MKISIITASFETDEGLLVSHGNQNNIITHEGQRGVFLPFPKNVSEEVLPISFYGIINEAPKDQLTIELRDSKLGRSIEVQKIVMLEGCGDNTLLYLKDGSVERSGWNMGHLENHVLPKTFIRIHHSYIIDKECIVRFEIASNSRNGAKIWMKYLNEPVIKVSRGRLPFFIKAMGITE